MVAAELSHASSRPTVQPTPANTIHEHRRPRISSFEQTSRIEKASVYGMRPSTSSQLCCMCWFVCATLLLAAIIVVVAL